MRTNGQDAASLSRSVEIEAHICHLCCTSIQAHYRALANQAAAKPGMSAGFEARTAARSSLTSSCTSGWASRYSLSDFRSFAFALSNFACSSGERGI